MEVHVINPTVIPLVIVENTIIDCEIYEVIDIGDAENPSKFGLVSNENAIVYRQSHQTDQLHVKVKDTPLIGSVGEESAIGNKNSVYLTKDHTPLGSLSKFPYGSGLPSQRVINENRIADPYIGQIHREARRACGTGVIQEEAISYHPFLPLLAPGFNAGGPQIVPIINHETSDEATPHRKIRMEGESGALILPESVYGIGSGE